MNFIVIQSRNTINGCHDPISEVNQFCVKVKSSDVAHSGRRERARRDNSHQSPQAVDLDEKPAAWDQRTETFCKAGMKKFKSSFHLSRALKKGHNKKYQFS